MMAVLILLVIFGGITAIVYADHAGKSARKAMTLAPQEAPPLPAAAAPTAPHAGRRPGIAGPAPARTGPHAGLGAAVHRA